MSRAVCVLVVLAAACSTENPPLAVLAPEPGEELSGGDTTVFDTTGEAFSRAAKNLTFDGREEFALGDHFFNRNWVTAPASAEGTDGLGPLYNATSCSACHFKDGRGRLPEEEGESFLSVLFRLSVPGEGAHGGPMPEPTYGGQLQPFAILGVTPEATPAVEWETILVEYADGTTEELRAPSYSFTELGYGELSVDVLISPRVAPHLVGLGLLAAIDEATLLALADPEDADGDGISGRSNLVWDDSAQHERLGRFGWKASQPTLLQQSAGASLGDLGITTPIYSSQECTSAQQDCRDALTGGDPELDESKLARITFYMHTLAVPARRDVGDPEVLAGRELFKELGCASCHTAVLETGQLAGYPELSGQTIRPFTDLLLHDMGEGLSDGRPDYLAEPREWRTPPLWGLGLLETVNEHTFLLHDGRARDFAEAILWHDGEGFASRERFRALERTDRDALVRFLESL